MPILLGLRDWEHHLGSDWDSRDASTNSRQHDASADLKAAKV